MLYQKGALRISQNSELFIDNMVKSKKTITFRIDAEINNI